MKIYDCFLDNRNGRAVCASTVGALIAPSGKPRLWEERRDGRVDTVVVHYISAVNVDKNRPYDLELILKIFCDYRVSSHYLITRRGRIFRLVPEEMKAWHAGLSMMPEPDNRTGVNEFSIGIELMATEDSGFTKLQYRALRELCLGIEKRCGRGMTYVGHDQIAGERAVALGVRADRKVDPGPMFDWDFFRKSLSR